MTLSKDTIVFGVKDCKIAKLLTDVTSAPTYDPVIDVPGIQEFGFKPNITSKELKGDEITIDSRSKIDFIEISVKNAKIALDALEVIFGGTLSSTGSTPNQKHKLAQKGADRPHFFKIEAQVIDVDDEDADLHFVSYKAKVSSVGDLGAVGDDYKVVSFTAKGIPCTSDDSFYDLDYNETAETIS